MCIPSRAAVTYWWSVIVSPACMTSGPPDAEAESVNIALKAADSEFPFCDTSQTGEHTVYAFGEYVTLYPPPAVQPVVMLFG